LLKVNAAIKAPTRRAHLELAVLGIEATDERLDLVGHVVAVSVFEEEDLAARGGDEAAVVGKEALHVVHVVGKGHGLVHAAVAVLVGEELDARKPRVAGIRRAERVVAHVGDEHAAFFVPRGLHGIEHERFGGDELHFVIAVELDALHGLSSGESGLSCPSRTAPMSLPPLAWMADHFSLNSPSGYNS
jgi:hypothetical protein